jgi:hypothetical protein
MNWSCIRPVCGQALVAAHIQRKLSNRQKVGHSLLRKRGVDLNLVKTLMPNRATELKLVQI